MTKAIPWVLLSVRLLIVPVFLFVPGQLSDRAVLWLYLLAFATDYFDGASARWLHIVTPALRKADSAADAVFHLALAFVLFRHHPDVFVQNKTALLLFVITAGGWYVLDAFRWHRFAGFHSWSAKAFSVGLMVWMVLPLGGCKTGPLLSGVLIFGAISNLEGIVISLRLRKDRADVPTVFHV